MSLDTLILTEKDMQSLQVIDILIRLQDDLSVVVQPNITDLTTLYKMNIKQEEKELIKHILKNNVRSFKEEQASKIRKIMFTEFYFQIHPYDENFLIQEIYNDDYERQVHFTLTFTRMPFWANNTGISYSNEDGYFTRQIEYLWSYDDILEWKDDVDRLMRLYNEKMRIFAAELLRRFIGIKE
jgi:hypothetical protein